MSRKLIFVCQICEKILTRNVGFWEEEKLGYLRKKKKTLPLKRFTLGFEPRPSLQMYHKQNLWRSM